MKTNFFARLMVLVSMTNAGIATSVFAQDSGDKLVKRSVLPAATFSNGPTSGRFIGDGSVNGQSVPFTGKQPVQGFSAVLDNKDGTFYALSDNGFGSMENSADYLLRIYHIKPSFKTKDGGSGTVEVLGFIQLSDPNKKIKFPITNHFTSERYLTGADFDIESFQKDANGDFWVGDEFGPFILHFDKTGRLLDAPYALPDFDNPGKELRAPQNPYNEEGATLRVMNAIRTHAEMHGAHMSPVFSPWEVLMADDDPSTHDASRTNPPSGLKAASSEIFNINAMKTAGYPVVVWTVNNFDRMRQLVDLKVDGIISDRPDLLYQLVSTYDSDMDGKPDFLTEEGLIDITLFDAQGHRGGRNLRPENTLPAMEVALDYLMTTLETDAGITRDGIPVLDHDPHIESAKARKADGSTYNYYSEVLVKDLTLAEIQTTFIADKLLSDRPEQTNDLSLSPVSVAFAAEKGFISPYIMPSVQQLFDFVNYYVWYYRSGPGMNHPDSERRWKNASKVRFNIETKINPRTDQDDRGDIFANRTKSYQEFANALAGVIIANNMQSRADIQSFDFRTLVEVQIKYPQIRTACLFGDFPKVGNVSDGTNMQDQNGDNTPWMAGLFWPYRETAVSAPFRVSTSGGFEGMALTKDGRNLLPLLEKPVLSGQPGELLIHEFNIGSKKYSEGVRYMYQMEPEGAAIGDFIMFSDTKGLIIERDNSQGNMNGHKKIYEITLTRAGEPVSKVLAVDLLKLNDPYRISEPGTSGDVGIGENFGFPFVTIESVVVFDDKHIGVLNDNNYPFSIGRHLGSGMPDDNEFIVIKLDRPLGKGDGKAIQDNDTTDNSKIKYSLAPNPFVNRVEARLEVKGNETLLVQVFDEYGTFVKEVGKFYNANGIYHVQWDGRNHSGQMLMPGFYYLVIQQGNTMIVERLVKN